MAFTQDEENTLRTMAIQIAQNNAISAVNQAALQSSQSVTAQLPPIEAQRQADVATIQGLTDVSAIITKQPTLATITNASAVVANSVKTGS